MSDTRSSYYVDSHGPQDAAIVRGFQWLVAEMQQTAKRGLVAVSQKAVLNNIARWSTYRVPLTQLAQHGSASLQGMTIELFTLRNDTSHWDGPILAIYGGQKLLDAVDGLAGSTAVLYVPWQSGEHADWAATWNATEVDSPAAEDAELQPTSGLAYIALDHLTHTVNLDTGILNSSDRAQAIQTLETALHHIPNLTPELIRRQLVRCGWHPEHAAEVKALAEQIRAGGRPRGATGRPNDDLWAYWNTRGATGA